MLYEAIGVRLVTYTIFDENPVYIFEWKTIHKKKYLSKNDCHNLGYNKNKQKN